MNEKRKALQGILDRASTDNSFRDRLIKNPNEALEALGLLSLIESGVEASSDCTSTCGNTCIETCSPATCRDSRD